ncbi:MAG: iron(III) transport system permease protein, partial [Halioglobus sp.]
MTARKPPLSSIPQLPDAAAVTGRVRAQWGSSPAYQSATPSAVSWPGGAFRYSASRIAGTRQLSNTAVHPARGSTPFPEIQYRKHFPGALKRPAHRVLDKTTGVDVNRRPQRIAPYGIWASIRGWPLMALIVAFIVCLPILSVLYLALNPEENIWPHLWDTVLLQYIANTLGLMFGVATGTLLIGVSTAWLVTRY